MNLNDIFVNFDFKNGCKNELEDNNEKSCCRFKNRIPLKIDFTADCTHESIPTAWELNELFDNRNNVTIKKLFVVIRSKAATTFCAS